MLPLQMMFLMDGLSVFGGWQMLALLAAPLVVIAVSSLEYPRLFIYTALLFFAVIEAEFLLRFLASPFNGVLAFGLPGIIITLYGLALLTRFTRQYPRPDEGAMHVG
jgi:hypothetical protein